MKELIVESTATTQHVWQHPTWYRALTLNERSPKERCFHQPAFTSQVEDRLAVHRLQAWKAQTPFQQESFFADRLHMDGLTEEQLFALLGASAEAVRDHTHLEPEWLKELRACF